LKYTDAHIGKRAKCQKCGLAFVIPPPGRAQPPAEPDIESDPSTDVVPMVESADAIEQVPALPRWEKLDLPVVTGYLYFLFGVINVILAVVVICGGADGCGRGPVVIIENDTSRAVTFYVVSVFFIAGNASLIALGYMFQVKTVGMIWIGIGLLGLLILIHGAYWVCLNFIPIGIIEGSILGGYIWLTVMSMKALNRELSAPSMAEFQIQ